MALLWSVYLTGAEVARGLVASRLGGGDDRTRVSSEHVGRLLTALALGPRRHWLIAIRQLSRAAQQKTGDVSQDGAVGGGAVKRGVGACVSGKGLSGVINARHRCLFVYGS